MWPISERRAGSHGNIFKMVGLEVYPMNSDEYAYLHQCGADYVTVFQETYDSDKYETLHLAGHKRIFPYRVNAQERALMGGMRGVAFAALLGLADFRKGCVCDRTSCVAAAAEVPVGRDFAFPVRGCVRLSTMTGLIRKMCMRNNCSRLCVHTVFSCRMRG